MSATAFAWWHDSVDYYYNHKIDARHKQHECRVDAMNATPAGSRRHEVLAAIVQIEQNPGSTSADYGITFQEYMIADATVRQISNECWNAITALHKR